MPHQIFLSHNQKDKPVVEPIALRLAEIFGEDQVFYDSWSIKPGDGIIDQMNEGLEAPEFVFFFVSANSLSSNMVKLEWQNAVYAASQGQTRIVPVRVDGTKMPPILMQTLYIDMQTIGLEAAIAQIVSVTQGNASFTPQHSGFSNLTYSATSAADGTVEIEVKASHLMEPNPSFIVLVGNEKTEVSSDVVGSTGFREGFYADQKLDNGSVCNCVALRPVDLSLTPDFPIKMQLKPRGGAKVDFRGVLHEKAQNIWTPVPQA